MQNLTSGPGGSPFVPWDPYGSRIRFAPPDEGDGPSGTFEPVTFRVGHDDPGETPSKPEVEVDLADPDKDARNARDSVDRGDRYKRDDDIEIVTDEDEKKAAKAAEAKPEEEGEDDTPVSERVQKRINKAIRAQRDAERAAQEAVQRAEAAEKQAREYGQRYQQADGAAFASYDKAVASEIAQLEREWKAATDAGDTDKQWEVQRKLASAQGRADWIEAQKRTRAQQTQQAQQQPEQPRQEAPRQKVDPATLKWVDTNSDWFRGTEPHHREMQAVAYANDAILKDEGYDPATPEFWQEMDKRLDARFPEHRGKPAQQGRHQGPGSPVAGVNRAAPGGKQRVTLSRDEQEVARKLGLSLKDYAQSKLQMEQAEAGNGSYF